MPVPLVFRIFWIAPIVVGAILAASTMQKVQSADASAGWHTTPAKIFNVGGQRGWLLSQQWGSYRWTYNGKEYTGSEIDCCGSKWGTYFDRAGVKKNGDEVVAFVDPADPARAVLMTGKSLRCYAPVLTGIAMIVAGLWIRKRITADAGNDERNRRGF